MHALGLYATPLNVKGHSTYYKEQPQFAIFQPNVFSFIVLTLLESVLGICYERARWQEWKNPARREKNRGTFQNHTFMIL